MYRLIKKIERLESKLQNKSKSGSLARFKGFQEAYSHDALICNGPFRPSIFPAVWEALVVISPKSKPYAALEQCRECNFTVIFNAELDSQPSAG